jgi:type I restriction enzyme M protein
MPLLYDGRGCAHQVHYRHTLENLGTVPGLVGIIFRKDQNKISPPSPRLRRTGNPSDLQLVIKMIADEDWSGMDVDIKGAIYEGCASGGRPCFFLARSVFGGFPL